MEWAGPCPQHLAPCGASCQTPKEDLCSKFGMDLKRGMLLRLARQDPQLHPDDPERRAAIYDKYKVRAPAFTYCSSWVPQLAGLLVPTLCSFLPTFSMLSALYPR